MTKALQGILFRYGTETVIARLMEQIRILAECDAVSTEVAAVVRQYASDIEYLYALCEYTNLITYTSEIPELTDGNWDDPEAKQELEEYAAANNANRADLYLFPSRE